MKMVFNTSPLTSSELLRLTGCSTEYSTCGSSWAFPPLWCTKRSLEMTTMVIRKEPTTVTAIMSRVCIGKGASVAGYIYHSQAH